MEKQNEKDESLKTKKNVSVKDIYKDVKRKNIMDWGEIETAESVIERKR